MGLIGAGIIGRRFAEIRDLPFGRQLADNVAFGIIFAVVADRPTVQPTKIARDEMLEPSTSMPHRAK
jgi:hypothetical protein